MGNRWNWGGDWCVGETEAVECRSTELMDMSSALERRLLIVVMAYKG